MSKIHMKSKSTSPGMWAWLQAMPLFQQDRWQSFVPYGTSFLLHAAVVILLACWIIPALQQGGDIDINASFTSADVAPAAQMTDPALDIAGVGGVEFSAAASVTAVPATQPQAQPVELAKSDSEVVFNTGVPSVSRMTDDEIMATVPILMSALPIHRHRGTTRVEQADGTGAIAATLQGELKSIAQEGDAVVVWMLDQSLSMQLDIKNLARQLAETLQQIEQDKSTIMTHYVVAFGDKVSVVQNATPKGYQVANAIFNLPPDPSGVENTFQSVEWCIDQLFNSYKWRLNKRAIERQKLLVVWTDESGDDYLRLEHTIQKCLANNVRVDIIGPSAVLGAQVGYTAFRHPDDGRTYQLPVHRGPDSSFPQKLSLGYWFRGVPDNYNELFRGPWPGGSSRFGGSNFDSLLSGFSPYALTRLARETGGRYTIFDRQADRAPFTLEQVREYMPDYRSISEIEFNLQRQPLRQIVLASAAETWKSGLTRFSQPALRFSEPIGGQDPIQFRRTTLPQRLRPAIARGLATAQDVERALTVFATAASIPSFKPNTAYTSRPDKFEEGLGIRQEQYAEEKKQESRLPDDQTPDEDRRQSPPSNRDIEAVQAEVNESLLEQVYYAEDSKRWRAWCDLNLGRLLAISVRLREYLIVTQAILENPNGLNPNSNSVWLTPTKKLVGGPVSTQRAAIAARMLQRCMDENPNTPWFVMAEQELRHGFGIQVNQTYIPKPPPPPPSPIPRKTPPRPVMPKL